MPEETHSTTNQESVRRRSQWWIGSGVAIALAISGLAYGVYRWQGSQETAPTRDTRANWETVKAQSLAGHSKAILSISLSPDSKTLATASEDQTIRLWNLQNGTLLRTLQEGNSSVLFVTFSPDGKTLASSSKDFMVRLWNPETGEILRTINPNAENSKPKLVRSLVFSPDGQQVITCSWDSTIKVWNRQTGELVRTLKGHTAGIFAIAISPNGAAVPSEFRGTRIATASQDKTIKLWNLQTGEVLRTLNGHLSSVRTVAFSPDGQQLVSGSNDRTIKLWNATSGDLIRTLPSENKANEGHKGFVNSVAFSPDGKNLVSSSEDGTLKLWNASTGEPIQTFLGHSGSVTSATFSADGQTLVSGSQDRTARIWQN